MLEVNRHSWWLVILEVVSAHFLNIDLINKGGKRSHSFSSLTLGRWLRREIKKNFIAIINTAGFMKDERPLRIIHARTNNKMLKQNKNTWKKTKNTQTYETLIIKFKVMHSGNRILWVSLQRARHIITVSRTN